MSRLRQEEVLLAELREAFGTDTRGFSAQSDGPSGGYGAETYSATSAEEAVRYTLEHVCRDARQNSPAG